MTPRPFRPRLRGLLLTGGEPRFLAADITRGPAIDSEAGVDPLWWPPSKIPGRFMTSYLAERGRLASATPPPAGSERPVRGRAGRSDLESAQRRSKRPPVRRSARGRLCRVAGPANGAPASRDASQPSGTAGGGTAARRARARPRSRRRPATRSPGCSPSRRSRDAPRPARRRAAARPRARRRRPSARRGSPSSSGKVRSERDHLPRVAVGERRDAHGHVLQQLGRARRPRRRRPPDRTAGRGRRRPASRPRRAPSAGPGSRSARARRRRAASAIRSAAASTSRCAGRGRARRRPTSVLCSSVGATALSATSPPSSRPRRAASSGRASTSCDSATRQAVAAEQPRRPRPGSSQRGAAPSAAAITAAGLLAAQRRRTRAPRPAARSRHTPYSAARASARAASSGNA